MGIDFQYIHLTPDDLFFDLADWTDKTYREEIQNHFDDYLKEISQIPEYKDISSAFLEDNEIIVPETRLQFLEKLANFYALEKPEWDAELETWKSTALSQNAQRFSQTGLSYVHRFTQGEPALREERVLNENPLLVPDDLGNWVSPDALFYRLSPQEVATVLCSQLNKVEIFLLFEEKYLSHSESIFYQHPEAIHKIRQHGKDLFGITDMANEIESQYGIKIETEDFSLLSYTEGEHTAKLASLTLIQKRLIEIKNILEIYPPQFFQSIKIEKIILLSQLYSAEKKRHASGLYLRESKIILLSCDPDRENVLPHEIYHALDKQLYDEVLNDHIWHDKAYQFHSQAYVNGVEVQGRAGKYKIQGFANDYGYVSLLLDKRFSEDQATVANLLFERSLQESKAQPFDEIDFYLAEKMYQIKSDLYAATQGRMDETFWQDYGRGVSIDADYWQEREKKHQETNQEFARDSNGEHLIQVQQALKEFKSIESVSFRKKKEFLEAVERLVALNPDNPDVYIQLTNAYYLNGDFIQARQAMEKCIKKGTTNPDVYERLLRQYRDDGLSIIEIIARLQRIRRSLLDYSVNQELLYAYIGKLSLEAGRPDKACEFYQEKILSDIKERGDSFYFFSFVEFLKDFYNQIPNTFFAESLSFICDHLTLSSQDNVVFFSTIKSLLEMQEYDVVLLILNSELVKYPEHERLEKLIQETELQKLDSEMPTARFQ